MQNKQSGKVVFTNLIWRFAERCGAQMVTFIVSVILARILEPSVYGMVALVNVFIFILQNFIDCGLGTALIQKRDADDIDFSTVFYVNLVFCAGLYLILFLCAPLIASIYNNNLYIAYVRVLGLTIVISGVKNIQQSYVSRTMQFKRFFFATLGGTIIAGCVGVSMALLGYGVWALIAQQIINMLIDTIVLWITVKWRPMMTFSWERLKGLFGFGWKLLISSLLNSFYDNVRSLIIGKMYTTADLAFYNRGNTFPKLIVTDINTSIDSVLFPVMSNAQDDLRRIKEMMRKSMKMSSYIMAPLMLGLAFSGDAVIRLFLTDKWISSLFYMRIFCVIYLFHPIHTANLNAIKAVGRSDLFLKLEIYKKIVGIILLLISVPIGVKAMAYSMLISTVFSLIMNSWPNRKLLNYRFVEQMKDIASSMALAIIMGFCIYPVQWVRLSNLATLLIQVTLGTLIYVVGSILFKLESFEYLWSMIKPIILKVIKRGEK